MSHYLLAGVILVPIIWLLSLLGYLAYWYDFRREARPRKGSGSPCRSG